MVTAAVAVVETAVAVVVGVAQSHLQLLAVVSMVTLQKRKRQSNSMVL